MIKKIVISFLLCCVIFSTLVFFAWHKANELVRQPLLLPTEGALMQIKPGDTVTTVAKQLVVMGALPHEKLMTVYARLTEQGGRLQVGEYQVKPPQTIDSLIALLESGKVVQYDVRFTEGKTIKDVFNELQEQSDLIKKLPPEWPQWNIKLKEQLNIKHEHLEGLILPETYYFTRGESELAVLKRAHSQLQKVLAEEWQARAKNLPYKTPYEALIMASIIEKETGLAIERQQIAGVFVRRLQKGMRLQTDPTVIYGIKDYQGNIKRSHLRDASNLYNTYRHHGLPPSPIALAGREAIYAALHPAAGEALYFVAKGDGSHVFSATLKAHQRAVRHYQIEKRRTDYQSAPQQSK